MFFKKNDKEYWDSLLKASLIGIHLVAATFIGFGIGYFLDNWLDTSPWFKIVFLLFGVAAGFRNMFQEVKKIYSSYDKKDHSDKTNHK